MSQDRLADRQSPDETAKVVDAKDRPLSVAITGDVLTISIGVETLAEAVQRGPWWPWDADSGVACRVCDTGLFSQDLLRELMREGEDGSTPVTRLLDAAGIDAMDQGSEGVTEVGPEGRIHD